MSQFDASFDTLAIDSSCIFSACQQKDLRLLRPVFQPLKLTINTSKSVRQYFLEFSNYDLSHEVAKVDSALKQLKKPLFSYGKHFPMLLSAALPPKAAKSLKPLISAEMARCFKLCFTSLGELQPCLEQLFKPGQLADLYEQFGASAVKFELLQAFFLRYCDLLGPLVDIPCEQTCSAVLKALMTYELTHYETVAKSLSYFESLLVKIEDSYKAKAAAMQVFKKMDEGFFSNQFLADQNVSSLINALCRVIEMPHDKRALFLLKEKMHQLSVRSNTAFWLDCLALISFFIGSCLLVSGMIGLATCASVPLSTAYAISGLTFFGGSAMAFQKGHSPSLLSTLNDFSKQARLIVQNS